MGVELNGFLEALDAPTLYKWHLAQGKSISITKITDMLEHLISGPSPASCQLRLRCPLTSVCYQNNSQTNGQICMKLYVSNENTARKD